MNLVHMVVLITFTVAYTLILTKRCRREKAKTPAAFPKVNRWMR